jgi:hypothetical protein
MLGRVHNLYLEGAAMSVKAASVLGACLVACCVLLTFSPGRPLAADPSGQHPSAVGRYQLLSRGEAGLAVEDTATGQCWVYSFNQGARVWMDLGTPAAKPK